VKNTIKEILKILSVFNLEIQIAKKINTFTRKMNLALNNAQKKPGKIIPFLLVNLFAKITNII
jgi:hypothetical protein